MVQFSVTPGGSSLPVGTYRVTLLGVKQTPPHPKFGRCCRLKFKVVGGEHDGEVATCICPLEKPASGSEV
jgi:hypothetical protein